jgi:enamine deaminase RidA (YjgF/YER057c/UK114 family)
MTISRIDSNPRLSGAATFKDLVFLSGQVPGEGLDVATQTREVLAKIDALLAQAGSDKNHLLNATIYLKDIGEGFAPMNEVRSAWLSPGMAPSRTTLQAELARPSVLVEISVIAVRK